MIICLRTSIADSKSEMMSCPLLYLRILSPRTFLRFISDFATYFCVLLRAYNTIPNTINSQSGSFFKVVETLPVGSTVLIVTGDIDCRGPVMNVAHRSGRSIPDVATECAQRYLTGVKKVKEEMGMNPILYAPTPNLFTDKDVRHWLMLPEYLTSEQWCRNKEEAVKVFDSVIKTSEFPVVSLVDWIFKEDIIYNKEYWCDQIHMSSAVWPQLRLEFSKIGIDLTESSVILKTSS